LIKKIGLLLGSLVAVLILAFSGIGVASATPVATSASGTTTCTTDGSAYCTIPHDLGKLPNSVVATSKSPALVGDVAVDNYTATSFRVRAFGANGTLITNRSITVSWAVFAGANVTTPPTTTPPTTQPTTIPPTTTPPTTDPTTVPPTTNPPADWPNADNTGPVDGTVLTNYTGSLSITSPNTVIDSKTVNGDLDIRTTGVVIKNSVINGEVSNYDNGVTSSFTIQDSIVKNGKRDACMCVGSHDFTASRLEVIGGNRGMYCEKNCTIQDTYVHGTDLKATQHASAIRVEQNATLIHNSLKCDWTAITDSEIGCSADMTGYPDFAPIKNNTIDHNFFFANPTGLGFCAYGGDTQGKPFSGDATNATNIVFKNNVFQKGSNGKCGEWGAITDFNPSRTGNVWTNNKWDDGSTVNPE
jgi:hypothetical protein